jgi:RNase P subunit RPR2
MKKVWRSAEQLIPQKIKGSFCPSCFTMLDAVTSMETKGADLPKPGDFTLCIKCHAVLKFTDDMTLVMSSLMEIPMNSRMRFAQVAAKLKEMGPIPGRANKTART